MQQYLQNKERLVHNVFNKVYDKYDLMNDFMSLGIHRIWKKDLIQSINKFITQDELVNYMKRCGFNNCSYRNLSGGIVAVHSGWKI